MTIQEVLQNITDGKYDNTAIFPQRYHDEELVNFVQRKREYRQKSSELEQVLKKDLEHVFSLQTYPKKEKIWNKALVTAYSEGLLFVAYEYENLTDIIHWTSPCTGDGLH